VGGLAGWLAVVKARSDIAVAVALEAVAAVNAATAGAHHVGAGLGVNGVGLLVVVNTVGAAHALEALGQEVAGVCAAVLGAALVEGIPGLFGRIWGRLVRVSRTHLACEAELSRSVRVIGPALDVSQRGHSTT
jgi:hypothetical protein